MKKNLYRLVSLLLSLLLLASPAVLAEDGTASGTVSISGKEYPFVLAAGGSSELHAEVSGGSAGDSVWSAKPEGIVSLTPNESDGSFCTVTAVSSGAATVTVTLGDSSDSCEFEVSGVAISGESSLMEGTSAALARTAYGAAKDVTEWEWYSDNSQVLRVAVDTGTVYAVGEGSAHVWCEGGGYTSNRWEIAVTSARAGAIRASLTGGKLPLSGLVEQMQERCQELMGSGLSYVSSIYTSPAQGTLYENYVDAGDTGSGVSSATRYYLGGSEARQIANITFVPKQDCDGEAEISYAGVTENGESFTGSILVDLSSDGEQTSGIAYSSLNGEAVRLDAADFSRYCREASGGREPDYVTFDLPKEKYGALCYYKTADGVYERAVDGNDRYGFYVSPRLNDVYFVPAAGYEGQLEIGFTIWDAAGQSYDDVFTVTVENNDAPVSAEAICYTVPAGSRVGFDPEDFSQACRDVLGGRLAYVTFDALPDAASGTLFYGDGSRAAQGMNFRVSGVSPLLEEVYFVPAGAAGAGATIPFTGYNAAGETFTGTVKIDVTAGTGDGTAAGSGYLGDMSYYTSGTAVNFSAAAFLAAVSSSLPDAVMGVKLELPPAAAGSLCSNFVSPLYYDSFNAFTYHKPEEMDSVYFLPKAGYRGTVELAYGAIDRSGNTCQGTLTIRVTPPTSSAYFTDLAGMSWAAPAVDFLCCYGVTNGVGPGIYGPLQSMRRGDFVLMLSRTFRFEDVYGAASFVDVPGDAYYAEAIAAASAMGIVASPADGRFRPEAVVTRQEAAVLLYRCMRTKGTELAAGTAEDLAAFSDAGQVAPYAVEAMGALARAGVFTGDGEGRLMPEKALNRAEMAAILYRALT